MSTEGNTPSTEGIPASAPKQAAGVLKRSSSYFIDPKRIVRREGWNPRFDFGEIENLAASIKANGMLNAIRVKRITGNPAADFELIDGDRRLTACEKLIKSGHEFPEGIPAIIVDKAQEDITSLVQMFAANDGKLFLPLEEAAAYKRMLDAGMTQKQICAAVGRKHMHVAQILALIDADESVKEALKDGKIGKTMAKEIASAAKGDKAKQAELVKAAADLGKDTKDKKRRRAVLKQIDDAKVKKATGKGKTLKMRALSDDQLAEMGEKLAKHLTVIMKETGLDPNADMRAWVGTSDQLAAAFTFGALEALKVAAGMKLSLEI